MRTRLYAHRVVQAGRRVQQTSDSRRSTVDSTWPATSIVVAKCCQQETDDGRLFMALGEVDVP